MKLLLILLSSLTFSSLSLATETIHYFDLTNRPASEVIPLIQPLLQENEAISGNGYQIFIKTTNQRQQEIETLISAIDKAIKTFRISVTNDEYITNSRNNIDGSITVRSDNTEAKLGSNAPRDSGAKIHVDTRNLEDKNSKTQFIKVQEGKPAFISRERLHIIPIYAYVQRPNGNFLIEHSQLSPSKQDGFYVVARSADSNFANITIQSTSSNTRTYQGYGQDQTYVDTNIRVPFGQWIEIGGNSTSRESETKGILYKTKKNDQRNKKVFLKIEIADI